MGPTDMAIVISTSYWISVAIAESLLLSSKSPPERLSTVPDRHPPDDKRQGSSYQKGSFGNGETLLARLKVNQWLKDLCSFRYMASHAGQRSFSVTE